MPNGADLLVIFVGAAALGAAVGIERQADEHEVTGARTFALYGVWGAGAAYVGDVYGGLAFAAMALAFAALTVAAYLISAREEHDPGTTTEAAGIVVFTTGILAYGGEWITAVALAVGTAITLGAKPTIHRMLAQVSRDDRRQAFQFTVMTGVVLPLVPDEPMGPYGAINPHQIWLMVVLVSGIGLIGYVALRLVGSRWLGFTGVVGGIVSSTAVTLGFSRMSSAKPQLRDVLAGGILGACALMFPRAVIEAAVIEPELGWMLAQYLVPLGLAVGVVATWWLRRPEHTSGGADADAVDLKNPLNLSVALQFGAFYGVVILVAEALVDRISESSLVLVGAVTGLTDIDAVTLAMANLVNDGLPTATGARTVLVAVAVNTAVKGLLVVLLGGRRLRRAVSTTLFPAAGAAAAAAFVVG